MTSETLTPRPLRIAVLARSVYPLHGYGGLERHVNDLIRHLLARDQYVTLIVPPPRAGRHDAPTWQEAIWRLRHERLTIRSVPYRTFPFAGRRGTTVLDRSTAYPYFGLRAGRLAASLAEARSIDVVHGFGASALGYARIRRRAQTGGVPLIFNPQGLEEFGATDPRRARLKRAAYRPLRMAVRACANSADRVIATDRCLQPVLETHLHVPAARICVIPNAVDLAVCDELAAAADGLALRQAYGIAVDEPILLSAGRIEQNKGYHVLVQALASLVNAGSLAGFRWVLVGDGPRRASLGRLIDAMGIRNRVILPGRVADPQLHAWYEAATVFVHPTLYEGSSLVTLEAMAHRRAVIASAAGGLPDKVHPGQNGWLVPAGDPVALASAIREAVSNPERLAAMGQESRAIVEREFSWPAAIDRLMELYEAVLGEQRRAAR